MRFSAKKSSKTSKVITLGTNQYEPEKNDMNGPEKPTSTEEPMHPPKNTVKPHALKIRKSAVKY